jgi:hypothetical protein
LGAPSGSLRLPAENPAKTRRSKAFESRWGFEPATATAILTVQEFSGGRARLGIATGDSAVPRLGARPVAIAELEGAVRTIRALLRGGSAPGEGGGFYATAAP